MSDLPVYMLDREFNAPRELVWRAWTDPKLVSRWYGPNIETIIHKFDLKPGGSWLNEMIWGENSDYSRMDFQEVTKHEKIVWHHCSTDAVWNVTPNAMMPDWPRVLLTTVEFEERGDKTNVRLTQVPMDATEAEITCFREKMANMDNGWGSGYKIMDEIFAKLMTSAD